MKNKLLWLKLSTLLISAVLGLLVILDIYANIFDGRLIDSIKDISLGRNDYAMNKSMYGLFTIIPTIIVLVLVVVFSGIIIKAKRCFLIKSLRKSVKDHRDNCTIKQKGTKK
jgi:hypothetical protein